MATKPTANDDVHSTPEAPAAFTVAQITDPMLAELAGDIVANDDVHATPARTHSLKGIVGRLARVPFAFSVVAYAPQHVPVGRDPVHEPITAELLATRAGFLRNAIRQNLVGAFMPVHRPPCSVRYADKGDWTKGYTWTAPYHGSLAASDPSVRHYKFAPGRVTLVRAEDVAAFLTQLQASVVEVCGPVDPAAALSGTSDEALESIKPFLMG
jgi:hypothetical protein